MKAKDYERLMEKILKNIFSNELSLFKTQCRTEDGINIFDMICKIKSGINDDFFISIYGSSFSLYVHDEP